MRRARRTKSAPVLALPGGTPLDRYADHGATMASAGNGRRSRRTSARSPHAPPPPGSEAAALRDQLSAFGPVLALSMLMTTAPNEREILRLATSAMPSLAHCRLEGVHIDNAWRIGAAGKAAGGVPLGPQLAALEGREG